MSAAQPVILVLLAGAVFYAIFLWRRLAGLEERLSAEAKAAETKRLELEKAKTESRERKNEVEELRESLQEARAKLKRQQRDNEQVPQKGKKSKGAPQPAAENAPQIVRVSNQELEAEHRAKVERLEAEIARLKADMQDQVARDAERKAAAERAARELAGTADAANSQAQDAAATVESLRSDLDAFKRAAIEREKELKHRLEDAEGRARGANKRAQNNLALYQVIKGHLELAEDRLAVYRRKYEGARSPSEFRPEKPRDTQKSSDVRTAAPKEPAPAEESDSSADASPMETASPEPAERHNADAAG